MTDQTNLREIRRIARRPYSFVALCSFCLAGLCSIQALIIYLFMTPMSGFESTLFYLCVAMIPIAMTQGLAARREKRMARVIHELLQEMEAPAAPSGRTVTRSGGPPSNG